MALYDFDERLRSVVFACLTPVELAFRSMLGHELGRRDPFIHLQPDSMGPAAREKSSPGEGSESYKKWRKRYNKELSQSREDFVLHHRNKYKGRLPVWVAVEVMDWGSLAYLYKLSSIDVREVVAARTGLSAAQLGSWIKVLNVFRNLSAHHARMFNRVYALKPKIPHGKACDEFGMKFDRCFGQLTLIQYLLDVLDIGDRRLLPNVLKTYPDISVVPISHVGAPRDWYDLRLWRV